MSRIYKVAYLVSHPIQYQAPLLRHLHGMPGLELTTFFLSDFSVRGYRDEGFGVEVAWDTPLLDGYRHVFLEPRKEGDIQGFWAAYPKTFAPIMDGGFDVLWVHGYAQAACLAAIRLARARGMNVLLRGESTLLSHPRGAGRRLAKQLLLRTLFKRIDGFLAIGRLNADYYRHYGVEAARLFPMPYAVDNERFRARSERGGEAVEALRRQWQLPEGRPVILFAAKFVARKRVRDLWAAYRLLSEDGREPEPLLLLAGDGEERAEVAREVLATGWRSVFLPGFVNQSQMPALYALADVFVLPSEFEPWGLVVNEAMNAGCAVVVSDRVGAGPDLVVPGETGEIYPFGDVAALADALRRLLGPGEAAAIGKRAREHVGRCSFEADAQGLMAALGQVAAGRSR